MKELEILSKDTSDITTTNHNNITSVGSIQESDLPEAPTTTLPQYESKNEIINNKLELSASF